MSVKVLILVVMEDGLRHQQNDILEKMDVLILVVMEDGLRHHEFHCKSYEYFVLILVVMEDGLRL